MFRNKFIDELSSLGYSERIQKMALLARDNKDNAKFEKFLEGLLNKGYYEANLAIVGASVINSETIIEKALSHNMAGIRKKATDLLARKASLQCIKDNIDNLSYACRKKLLKDIVIFKRMEIADGILDLVIDKYGYKEASFILSACSEEMVRDNIDVIGEYVVNWSGLANRHSLLTLKYFKESLLKESDNNKIYVWYRFYDAFDVLALKYTKELIECIEIGPQDIIFTTLRNRLKVMFKKYPDKLFEILMCEKCKKKLINNGVPSAIINNKKHFSINQWIEICKILKSQYKEVTKILKVMSNNEKKIIFNNVYDENSNVIYPIDFMYILPDEIRNKEALRILQINEIKDDKYKYLKYTACINNEEARDYIKKFAKASTAEDRQSGLLALINNTNLYKEHMNDTLEFLARIKNDQDPVKCTAIGALASCKAKLFDESSIEKLNEFLDSIVDSRDTSYNTMSLARKLINNIFDYNKKDCDSTLFKFSLDKMLILAKKDGNINLSSLSNNLPKGYETIIFNKLSSFLDSEARRENYNYIIDIARVLGKRGYNIPFLQDLLKTTILESKNNYSINQAIFYYLKDKRTRDKRVRELLSIDKSFIEAMPVMSHLNRRRQELLDTYIDKSIIKGRLLTGKTIYLLPIESGFDKWLPYQQEMYYKLLKMIASSPSYNIYERANAIKKMAKMPDIDISKIESYVYSDETSISEAALHALSLTNYSKEAIKVLMKYLDGDKAKVSMYSLNRCIRNVKYSDFEEIIKEIFNKDRCKITVKKEACRLIGAYNCKDSLQILMDEVKKENVHRDVAIAISHAARNMLNEEISWDILNEILAKNNNEITSSIIYQNPFEVPRKYRMRYINLLIIASKSNDSYVKKCAFSALKRWESSNENMISNVLINSIMDFEDTSWKEALNTLLSSEKSWDYVIDIIEKLIKINANECNMENRIRLTEIIDKVTKIEDKDIDKCKVVIEKLQKEESLNYLLSKLCVSLIKWENLNLSMEYIDIIAKNIRNMPFYIGKVNDLITDSINDNKGMYEDENLLTFIDKIKDNSTEHKYIALNILEITGKNLAWNDKCEEFVNYFRNDKEIRISSIALNIFAV